MVVLVRCCCCGCDLSTGVFLLAVLSAVGGGYGIYSSFNSASTLTRFREDLMENPELHSLLPVPLKYYDVVTNLLKTDGVFNIIVVLTSLLLLGAHNSLHLGNLGYARFCKSMLLIILTSLVCTNKNQKNFCSKKNRFLALPYLAWHAILLVYNLGVTIFYIIIWKGFAVIGIAIFNAIFWVLSIYFLIVVYSFHEALREDPSGVSAGYRPPNRPGQAASGPPVAAAQMYKPDV